MEKYTGIVGKELLMKTVLFTQRVEIIENYHERRDCADQRISDFIMACGFLPVPVPNNIHIAKALVDELEPIGIILTGGNSLAEFGGNAPERDAVDEQLIQISIERNIPLYGFCRGMQSILVYFGNKLTSVVGHVAVRHALVGNMEREVNSYHNQGCVWLDTNSGLECIACTEDGVIESVIHKDYPIYATMWHPEREEKFSQSDVENVRKLFLEERK